MTISCCLVKILTKHWLNSKIRCQDWQFALVNIHYSNLGLRKYLRKDLIKNIVIYQLAIKKAVN